MGTNPSSSQPSEEPRKAYEVEEASKGSVFHLVYANTVQEIRENWPDVDREAIEYQTHPAGLRSIRRRPEDDR